MCVGWRGTALLHCCPAPLMYRRTAPSRQVYNLLDNYRSSARIVATAQHVIAANTDWQRSALRPLRSEGPPIEARGAGAGAGAGAEGGGPDGAAPCGVATAGRRGAARILGCSRTPSSAPQHCLAVLVPPLAQVHVLRDSQEEARFLAEEIAGALARREHPAEQVAVLLRTHVQSRLVEQELVGMPQPMLP